MQFAAFPSKFSLRILPLIAFFIVAIPVLSFADDTGQRKNKVRLYTYPVIQLSSAQQIRSGLKVASLKRVIYRPESIAYGEAIDLQPLLDLRGQYFQAKTDFKITASQLRLAQQVYARVRDLYRNKAIAKRKLQAQKAQMDEAQAHHDAIAYKLKSLQDSALLTWGALLTDWAFSADSEEFSRLISGEQSLLQITLPPKQALPRDTEFIFIAHTGYRKDAIKARFLSPSKETDEDYQGLSYFFLAPDYIQMGLHVTAWISQHQGSPGIMIPYSAVIRLLGQAYVYLQTAEDQFTRYSISTQQPTADGYFVRGGIVPGDNLVISGAQMLLSAEFRSQIPEEDDD